MISLEERVGAAFDALEYPDVDLVDAILVAIENDTPTPHRSAQSVWRRSLLAAAAALILIIAIVAVTPARDVVARWFGIGVTQIEIVPTTSPGQDAAGSNDASVSDDDLFANVTQAPPVQSDADPIPDLGRPTAVFNGEAGMGRKYVWDATADIPALPGTDAGVTLSVRVSDGLLDHKNVSDDVTIEHLRLGSSIVAVKAIWIGGSHEYIASGSESVIAERVLLWEVDGLQYRLESTLGLDDSIALALLVVEGTNLLQPG